MTQAPLQHRWAVLAFVISLAIPVPAFASDPAPLAGVIFVAGMVALLVGAGLAAPHRFVAIALGVLGLIPIAYGSMLAFVYIGNEAALAAFGFLMAVVVFGSTVFWRIHRDYLKES